MTHMLLETNIVTSCLAQISFRFTITERWWYMPCQGWWELSGPPVDWKVGCSIHGLWVNRRSALSARALASNAPAKGIIQALTCRQLSIKNLSNGMRFGKKESFIVSKTFCLILSRTKILLKISVLSHAFFAFKNDFCCDKPASVLIVFFHTKNNRKCLLKMIRKNFQTPFLKTLFWIWDQY